MNEENSFSGYLIVNVSTARGSIPLSGALVTVFSGADGEVIYTLTSDSSGNTERVALPAPSRANSLSPGLAPPYATYNINVYKEGYFKNEYVSVAVFADTTTLQNAVLIPLPEYRERPYDDSISFDDSENPNLYPEL